ncbi:unnamed protein product [Blepharisma stoltei]|uniref:Uncharacterized protein n=1 Tax=Blepharisma stoltei TaxID=1481888 RepID=A0AAU9IHQ1_9CILI|nr:unnamed protein product [Blepharisma stoltei]
MDNSTRQLYTKVLNTVDRFKQNVDAIFTAKMNCDSELLPSLLARNRGVLVDLKKAERNLKISIEFQKSQNQSEKELTNSMMDQLHALEYEKKALENEIKFCKEKEDQELRELGYDVNGDWEEIVEKLWKEHEESARMAATEERGLVCESKSLDKEADEFENADEATVSSTVPNLESVLDSILNDEETENDGEDSDLD